MSKSVVGIIVIKDRVVDSIKTFNDDHEGNAAAESEFIAQCHNCIWNFDEYTAEDIDAILEQGYENWGDGNSICITHFDIP